MKMNSSFRFCIRKVICSIKAVRQKSSASDREARMLQKMIDRGLNKSNSKFQGPKVLKKRNMISAYENEDTNKRMDVFNKLYMEHIPEMVYSGDFGSYFNDLKIQISKVQISKDFNFLNIYYITKGSDTPEHVIDDFLYKLVRQIQTRVSNLRLSSKIPTVRFIKDIRLENDMKLERIFETIDFGKDFVPTHPKNVFTSDIISKPGDPPLMRQDVLGVDVAKIKQRISDSIFRFKAINTAVSDESSEKPEYPTKLIKFTKKEFFKFYKRKRIEELKRVKRERRALFMHDSQGEDECGTDYEDVYENMYEDIHEDEFEGEYENEDEDEFEGEGEYESEDEDESKKIRERSEGSLINVK